MLAPADIVIRLGCAAVLGSAVGLDRERLEWAAGLRTHMLVCVGSALMMIVSAFGFADVLGTPNVVLDPSRIAAQVVSGIGFLGAGTILLSRQQVVRGLTTAASLWTVAGVGLAVGGGMYLAATSATALTILILAAIKPLEKRLFGRLRHRIVTILIHRGDGVLAAIESILDAAGTGVGKITVQRTDSSDVDEVHVHLSRGLAPEQSLGLLDKLRALDAVKQVDF
jgi:putative Mg2+ transporter-C (MgtC) family protein